MVWYSHLSQNFPQFIVIHTDKSFGIVNKAGIDGILELSCSLDDPADVGNLISGSFAFSKISLNCSKALSKDRGVGDSPMAGMILLLISILIHPASQR